MGISFIGAAKSLFEVGQTEAISSYVKLAKLAGVRADVALRILDAERARRKPA